MKIERPRDHTVVTNYLRSGGICIDCGAHRGEFSLWASEKHNLKVYGFEPDQCLFTDLPSLPQVVFMQAAVAGKAGVGKFFKSPDTDGTLVMDDYVPWDYLVNKISLDEFINESRIDRIELIKLDIEGGEIEVLSSLSPEVLKQIKQITVEFHDFLDSESKPAILNLLEKLKRDGFLVIKSSFHTYGDVLLLNRRLLRIGCLDRIILEFKIKFLGRLGRLLNRRF